MENQWLPSKRTKKQLKGSDVDLHQTNEQKLDKAEEEYDLVGGPAVSINLDPGVLSDTGPPTR